MFVELAEMDSPISIANMHPYGRRRGANGRTGARWLPKIDMLLCTFMMG
ncbi:hypothetical protein MTsPCn9_19620 [Croceitalea sp. MTPC9]|nr:hypothetical protein MTsPCn6_12470 [Croceitalea sp. MTPC6]GMN17026.1 hypothetical protein MTsPCn9_19620 [Croceitalea sp. MTPC9]